MGGFLSGVTRGLFAASRASNMANHASKGPGSLGKHLVRKAVIRSVFKLFR